MKRELLDNGNIWQKSDGRWIGLVRYKDEFGETQRKSFSSKKKKTLQAKMTVYVKNFNEQVASSDESKKPLKESMKNWLRVSATSLSEMLLLPILRNYSLST